MTITAPATATTSRPAPSKPEGKNRLGKSALTVVTWLIGLVFITPVAWMVLTSFHSEIDAASNPPDIFAPLTLDGYRTFFGGESGASPWPSLINSAWASIDGANLVQTLRRIIVPIISPGIAATALICFIFAWNELLFAKVLTGVVAQTAPVYLTGFVTSQGLFLAQLCAATTVVSLPVLIAGFAAQDKLVQGLSLGAVK
jgi:ABC-type glycerol-3-phosphate transport system permease component